MILVYLAFVLLAILVSMYKSKKKENDKKMNKRCNNIIGRSNLFQELLDLLVKLLFLGTKKQSSR